MLTKLAYSNVWLALSASGLALAVAALTGTTLDAVALVLPTLIAYVVYTFDKVVKLDPVADALNDPARTALLVRHRPLLLTLAGLALVGGTLMAATKNLETVVLFLVPLPIGIAYSTPFMPKRFRVRRLKDITGGKSLVVAATWAIMTVSLPLAAVESQADGVLVFFAFAWVTARFFVNTVLFDIDDVPGDRAAGTRTLPVWLGVASTFEILFTMLALSLGLGVGLVATSPELGFALFVVGACFAFDVAYLEAARRRRGPLGFLGDVVADGLGVWSGALAVAMLALT